MTETVLEKTENAVVHLFLDLDNELLTQGAVDCRARLLSLVEQKRKIEHAEFGDAIGQVAARLIAEREQPMFNQPQDVLGPIAEVHDVPHVLDVDAVAEFGAKTVADALQGEAEACRRRPVAAHAYLDRISHLSLRVSLRAIAARCHLAPHSRLF